MGDRYQSFGRSPGARGVSNRRVFEEGERISAASSRINRERIDSPSSPSRTASSVTSRLNRMNIDDRDKDESVDDTKNRDDADHEEIPSARSRLKKDTGARSRAADNDGENDEKEGKDDAPKRS